MSVRAEPLRVVVAGGGVAALETTLALRALAPEKVSIELVAPDSDFVYRPLAVSAPFRVGETRSFPLAALAKAAGGELRSDMVDTVDADRWVVETARGIEIPYDVLVVAVGARPRVAVTNALTFAGPESTASLTALLEQAISGAIRRIVFALPPGAAWPLPLYELALMTNNYLVERSAMGVEIMVVTPEERPLGLFGTVAADAISELLDIRGIRFQGGTTPVSFADGALLVAPEDEIPADRVVTLPRLEGPRLPGLPFDHDGFIPTDQYCRVGLEPAVYAVGDSSQFPVKQGGIATQQADVAASDIAARLGGALGPPFKPVLRGLLLTGMAARYLRSEPGSPQSAVDTEPLWWPPAKIVGRYLAPFLAAELGLSDVLAPPGIPAVPVEIELDPREHAVWAGV